MTARFTILLLLISAFSYSQVTEDSIYQVPSQYLEKVASKASSLESKLDKKADKILARLQRQEDRMRKKLSKIDSLAAHNIFTSAAGKYKDLEQRLKNNSVTGPYIPKLDSLVTSLKFIQQNPQLIKQVREGKEKLKEAMAKMDGLKDQLQKAEAIKQFIKERKQFLKEQLSKFGFAKELKKLNKEYFYYAQQVNEYKEILKDSKKAERKALELLSKTRLFQNFMKKNSQLASLFPMPGGNASSSSGGQSGFAGLQTRAQLASFMQQTGVSGPGGIARLQRNIQDVQSQVAQIRNEISRIMGVEENSLDMPDFKPNNQKTKSFFKRLEYGTTLQSQKASGYFPSTSDLGLSVGYKMNDKSVLGLGASYKIGLGTGWNNIRLSNQGVGLRSFIDWKIKGSIWISGGYEQNYRTLFNSIDQLRNLNAWQQSGLLGFSKVVSLKTKLLRKTKVQLLWDFLSYDQLPRTQPIIFRLGYSF